ncbi:MAG: ribonuclease III [Gemmatimonadaceae bacterium]|nr:ribonuclease III [Gloeobacterales cyanobacterium ES-bin-141]
MNIGWRSYVSHQPETTGEQVILSRQAQLKQLIQGLVQPRQTASINWALLDQSLIHPSYCGGDSDYHNDRLEFLGDEVVRLLATEFLWQKYAHLPVGELTAVRSVLVSDRVLSGLAREYRLDAYLKVGGSEDAGGETSRLAASFEAFLAALYLSTGNAELIRPWLLPRLDALAAAVLADPVRGNYRTALQEFTQKYFSLLPDYRVSDGTTTGPHFTCTVWLKDRCWGEGGGRTKKLAQAAAARVAYCALRAEYDC